MKLTSHLLLLLAALSIYGQGQSQTITCSSNNGRRNVCNVNTRGGVRISRQISGTPCIQDQTWGWDNNSVWVDRGCRAEFIVGSGSQPGANRARPSPAPPTTAVATSATSTPVAASASPARSAAPPASRTRPGDGTTAAYGSTAAVAPSSSSEAVGNNWNPGPAPGRPGSGGNQTPTHHLFLQRRQA